MGLNKGRRPKRKCWVKRKVGGKGKHSNMFHMRIEVQKFGSMLKPLGPKDVVSASFLTFTTFSCSLIGVGGAFKDQEEEPFGLVSSTIPIPLPLALSSSMILNNAQVYKNVDHKKLRWRLLFFVNAFKFHGRHWCTRTFVHTHIYLNRETAIWLDVKVSCC